MIHCIVQGPDERNLHGEMLSVRIKSAKAFLFLAFNVLEMLPWSHMATESSVILRSCKRSWGDKRTNPFYFLYYTVLISGLLLNWYGLKYRFLYRLLSTQKTVYYKNEFFKMPEQSSLLIDNTSYFKLPQASIKVDFIDKNKCQVFCYFKIRISAHFTPRINLVH